MFKADKFYLHAVYAGIIIILAIAGPVSGYLYFKATNDNHIIEQINAPLVNEPGNSDSTHSLPVIANTPALDSAKKEVIKQGERVANEIAFQGKAVNDSNDILLQNYNDAITNNISLKKENIQLASINDALQKKLIDSSNVITSQKKIIMLQEYCAMLT